MFTELKYTVNMDGWMLVAGTRPLCLDRKGMEQCSYTMICCADILDRQADFRLAKTVM